MEMLQALFKHKSLHKPSAHQTTSVLFPNARLDSDGIEHASALIDCVFLYLSVWKVCAFLSVSVSVVCVCVCGVWVLLWSTAEIEKERKR